MIQIDMEMPENCLRCPMQFGGWCYVSPPEVDERVAPTVDEKQAEVVRAAAVFLVPVETGELRSSIHTDVEHKDGGTQGVP